MTYAYRIVSSIARTQHGEIFQCERQATATATGEMVAVKCIQPVCETEADAPTKRHRRADDPLQEKKVVDDLVASGGHDNLVRSYEAFIDNGVLFLVTEYCPQGDLHAYLQSLPVPMLTESMSLKFIRQIVLGVQFLHNKGIAHRDLSLKNVLLSDGVCKITDFGLSTRADRVRTEFAGKAYYMAPEIVAGEPYDPKQADVWSVGIMLFIMLTGSPLVELAAQEDEGLRALVSHGVDAIL